MISLQINQGVSSDARLVRFTRKSAVVEFSDREAEFKISEPLGKLRIGIERGFRYDGPAVIKSCVRTGAATVCELGLDETSWTETSASAAELSEAKLRSEFKVFLNKYELTSTIRSDYRVVIAEMHSFFTSLQVWLDGIEARVQLDSPDEHDQRVCDAADVLHDVILPCIDALFEKFERIADGLAQGEHPAHRGYMRRLLHPLILHAPFAYRTFMKPLGYAGDYQMVNLLFSESPMGASLYAKLINAWFVKQPPAQAHRNRIEYLVDALSASAFRATADQRKPRFLSLGCGPAIEVQRYVRQRPRVPDADFTLLDFNQETLDYAKQAISTASRISHVPIDCRFECKSVTQVLKESAGRQLRIPSQYDVVYCAGLFDYLTTPACQQLATALFAMVRSGGVLLLTNVNDCNPLKHGMDHLLDWNLIYRTVPEMLKIVPVEAVAGSARALVDDTGVNVFLEVERPIDD